MTTIGIEGARKTLGDLVTAAQQGTDIIITRNRRPVARLTAYQEDTMTTETHRLAYLAVHSQGWDNAKDLVILVAPSDQMEAMTTLAERICTVNGKYHRADPKWAWGMAEHQADVFYGYRNGQEAEEVPTAVRIARYAERTVEDFGADFELIAARLRWYR